MKTENTLHFRIDTPAVLKEIMDNNSTMQVFKIPFSILQNLLGQTAQRAIQINDPILNKLMFDLGLYEHPSPTSDEYGKMMKRIYEEAEKEYLKNKTEKP